ncbi:(-)-kolavenyl diphosphate synthase TPS28, chloroplastic-like [Pistacia vera]|uniref:(-)-kolavenyl diphosphate synthase TPS28, chloroplastic-like n=1 Tax=Pistacia vera TaxID=55513 RepID=UPI001263D036|nr:(-)-kolavenyl diphosphate synthase TPS28, chloroplastic-like [Pistacia vera]
MLSSLNDGGISVSAYDTAWVALIEDIEGSGASQFPSALQWIADNQLPDGSWGEDKIFSAYDRLISTIACVVALKRWNIHQDRCEKGLSFFKENISKLENESDAHMPCGFEIIFPALLDKARSLEIEVPDHSPALQDIYAKRNFKLSRIPKDKLHSVPTTLLGSLEGMQDLNWEKLLKLQFQDGSFFSSLSSTAYAFMQTKNENCLKFLTKVVQEFNAGVPTLYPVDVYEHIWVVDRLLRLGISRYFQPEFKECMDYVYRYVTEEGIPFQRQGRIPDLDDTAMGFRLLRLHGYEVSADIFRHFEDGGEFFCFPGQSTEGVTVIFNLYRASQVLFPGEKILENAKKFSEKILREKHAANELLDKWLIAKDLPGEVSFALEVPLYARFPRVETRLYIEQYGGEDDIWIGKVLYRMLNVNTKIYLELAKLDYNNCQALHQTEWNSMQRWYSECTLENFGMSRRALLLAYFLASASIYEPEKWLERIAWAKTSVLVETITSHFHKTKHSREQRKAFVDEFRNCTNRSNYKNGRAINNLFQLRLGSDKIEQGLSQILLGTLNHLSSNALAAQGRDMSHHIHQAWGKWLMKWQEEGDRHEGEAELLVYTINLFAGHWFSDELLHHPLYKRLSDLTNRICSKLGNYQKQKVHDNGSNNANSDSITTFQVESEMQELVQLVLQNSSNDIDFNVKQTFLTVAKSFYYTAYCDTQTVNFHIVKVLFQRVT